MAPDHRYPKNGRKPQVEHPSDRPNLILLLTAISCQLTWFCTLPVYSSVNAGTFPFVSVLLDFCMLFPSFFVYNAVSRRRTELLEWFINLISLFGCAVPALTDYVGRYSEGIGPQWAPLMFILLIRVALVQLALMLYSTKRSQEPKATIETRWFWPACRLVWAHGLLILFEKVVYSILYSPFGLLALSFVGRYGLQMASSCGFAYLGRWKMAIVTLPILLIIAGSPHLPLQPNTARLNARLETEGYRLIDRKESVTGYISVLENINDGFRALRCDHSLLGGVWIDYHADYVPRLQNPIYAIFVMLEAVRLVQAEEPANTISKPDKEKQALFIGLGVGTSPAAFIYHGIATTVVEIDPVVYAFATKYFDLPTNHTSIIEDATDFVGKNRVSDGARYDYIVHDVFTSGAEPLELFTVDFLSGLHDSLHDDGSIAINYAGGLRLPSAAAVVKTVLAVFPTCRLFRETAVEPESVGAKWDLTNMVIFCRKTKSELLFRDPVEADFLGSPARRKHLLPQHEMPISQFLGNDQKIITTANVKDFEASRWRNALIHWMVMRHVIPAAVWENW